MQGNDQPAPTQTVNYTLGPDQQRILNAAMPSITDFGATTPTRYQGSTVAGFTTPEVQGQQMALDAAGKQGTVAGNAGDLTNKLLSSDPNSMRDEAIAASVKPLYDNLLQTVFPGISSGAAGGGTYGSSRSGIAQGKAIEATNRDAGETAAKLAASIYGTDVGARMQALGLVPQTQQSYLAPATTTSGVGDVQRAQNQALIDEAVRNYNFDVNKTGELSKAQDLIALLGGLPEGGSVATGSVPPTNTLGQVLGGAATGATIGGAVGGPIGAGIGGLGGAVLPFVFR